MLHRWLGPFFDIPAWPETWNEEIVPPPPSWPDLERPPSHTATYSEVGASAIESESEASDVDSGDPPPGEDVEVDALEPSVVASTFPTITNGMTGVTHAARQVEECDVVGKEEQSIWLNAAWWQAACGVSLKLPATCYQIEMGTSTDGGPCGRHRCAKAWREGLFV